MKNIGERRIIEGRRIEAAGSRRQRPALDRMVTRLPIGLVDTVQTAVKRVGGRLSTPISAQRTDDGGNGSQTDATDSTATWGSDTTTGGFEWQTELAGGTDDEPDDDQTETMTDEAAESAIGDRLDEHDIDVVDLWVTDNEVHLEYWTEHTSNDAIGDEMMTVATEYAATIDAGLEADRLNATITNGKYTFAEWHVRTEWADGLNSGTLSEEALATNVSDTTTLNIG